MDELLSKEKTPSVLLLEPLHSARLHTGGNKKERKKKEINKHHPLCLHLPLIYGPAEKPCCPQLLGSQLLFAMIFAPSFHLPPQQILSCRVLSQRALPAPGALGGLSQLCPVPWWDGDCWDSSWSPETGAGMRESRMQSSKEAESSQVDCK